jgi:integral membrane sensor domain MASE1
LLTAAIVAVVYAVAGEFGLRAGAALDVVTPVWPATGVAVTAFVLFGRRVWVGIAVAAAGLNIAHGASVPLSAVLAVGNTLAPLTACVLLERFDFRPSIARLRDVVALVTAGALLPMTISATGGAAALALFGETSTLDTWITWWMGDALGVVLFAPVFMTMLANDGHLASRAKQAFALLGLLGASTIVAVVTDSPIG